MNMLEVKNLKVNYGQVVAVKKVDLHVAKGETVVLLGANGAGKSSTLLSIAGVSNKGEGEVDFLGSSITKLSPEKILSLGIATVPENRDIFPDLLVEENIVLGGYINRKNSKIIKQTRNEVYDLFPILFERKNQVAGTLSGGEQQMLAIGRAMMARPKMLLLDEPSLGIAPKLVNQIFIAIKNINKQKKVTIFLVEQNAKKALELADRGYVLVNGNVTLEGAGQDLLKNKDIQAAYLEGGGKK